jgi:hypothetical protein
LLGRWALAELLPSKTVTRSTPLGTSLNKGVLGVLQWDDSEAIFNLFSLLQRMGVFVVSLFDFRLFSFI